MLSCYLSFVLSSGSIGSSRSALSPPGMKQKVGALRTWLVPQKQDSNFEVKSHFGPVRSGEAQELGPSYKEVTDKDSILRAS